MFIGVKAKEHIHFNMVECMFMLIGTLNRVECRNVFKLSTNTFYHEGCEKKYLNLPRTKSALNVILE